MSRASELQELIAEAETRRGLCARQAGLLAERVKGLRDDNPRDPRLHDLSVAIEDLDEEHDRLSDQIGRLKNQLWEIEAQHARRCLCNGLNPSEY